MEAKTYMLNKHGLIVIKLSIFLLILSTLFIPLPYLLTSGLMHDVAYGIRDLKYNSVEVKTITIIILKAKHSHVIPSDIQKYHMSQFQHLSGKTLLRLMLDIMLF